MRTKGTKYDKIDVLPAGALPVSRFAKITNTSPAYVHVKFDRHKFGYFPKGSTDIKYAPHPKYDIKDYEGMAYVIEA